MARKRSFVRLAANTKMWVGIGAGSEQVDASTVELLTESNASLLALRPFTILRTHILLHYRSDQQAAAEFAFGTYALLVVTEQAATAGIASIPNPSSLSGDPDAAWFAIQPVAAFFQFISGTGFANDAGAQYLLDSKAMRKVGNNDTIVSVFTQGAAVGGNIFENGRMLIKLH